MAEIRPPSRRARSRSAEERAQDGLDPKERQNIHPEQQDTSEEEEGTPEPEGQEHPEPSEEDRHSAPPLPDENPPPLPNEAPPNPEDDGWEPVWDAGAQTYYFYNRFTGVSQWENPRVPGAQPEAEEPQPTAPVAGGYNPAIHGDYDPTAPYAQQCGQSPEDPTLPAGAPGTDPADPGYVAAGAFNRFTGKWQAMSVTPENYNDENKARRQMSAFFDVDAAANSHDGRSLRAERSAKKLSRKEVKMFKEKRREKKEEKRRAWLRD